MKRTRRHRRSRSTARARRRLRLESLESRRVLASLVVTTVADDIDANDGLLSLREAINQANLEPGLDTISFDSSVFSRPTTIDLALGQLQVTDTVEIVGPGKGQLTIDASGESRILEVFAYDSDVTLRGMTLTGGRTTSDDVNFSQSGGGIRFASAGTLTLDRVDLIGNQTEGIEARGGAIFAEPGNVSIMNSSIVENETAGEDSPGGAVFLGSGSLDIADSIVSGNKTTGIGSRGGGIYSSGATISISRSLVADNATEQAQADGGAIWTSADLSIAQSHLVGNHTAGTDSDGGAIFSFGSVSVSDSDLSNNRTDGIGASGGALAVDSEALTIQRSSITGNQTASQFSYGGGVFAIRSDIEIQNSTVSHNVGLGNSSDGGGLAIFFSSTVIRGTTVTANETVGTGGGILMVDNTNRRFQVENSIIAGNTDDGTAPDFLPPANPGSLTVLSSLIGDNTGTNLNGSSTPDFQGNLVGDPAGSGLIDPRLEPLMQTGVTRVHPLMASSPAINRGDNSLTLGQLTDQRGGPFVRFFGGTIDMGAFESQVLSASRFDVDTLEDELDFANSLTSLREAIVAANGRAGHDSITFDDELFDNVAQIDLNNPLTITDSLSIEVDQGETVTLVGDGLQRIFDITEQAGDVDLHQLILRGGRSTGPEGGGAGIRFASSGVLALTDIEISGHQTFGRFAPGAAVYAAIGTVQLVRATVTNNQTFGDDSGGGGIHANALVAENSTISHNETSGDRSHGGGVEVVGSTGASLQIARSTVAQNRVTGATSNGGGIAIQSGESSITLTTISTNASNSDGAGVYWANDGVSSDHQVLATTIANNTAVGSGGGIFLQSDAGDRVEVSSSLIAQNLADTSNPDLDLSQAIGTLTITGSLVGDNAGTDLTESPTGDTNGNLIGSSSGGGVIDPRLTPLSRRGGRTESHGLLSDSPAIDAGDTASVASLTTDQRGQPFVRVFGSDADIGAIETQTLDPQFLIVSTTQDEFDFDYSEISLREAIELSVASLGVDTIQFDEDVFDEPQVITLLLGPIVLSEDVFIEGPGDELLTIDADSNHRVVDIPGSDPMVSTINVAIAGVTLTNGVANTGSGGGIRFESDGQLLLQDVSLIENETLDDDAGGGGLSVDGGSLRIIDSLIHQNRTLGDRSGGGGILINDGQAEIIATMISENQTTRDSSEGGGLFAIQSDVSFDEVDVIANITLGNDSGGGGFSVDRGNLSIVASHIDQNETFGESAGGGLKTELSDVDIFSSSITHNQTSHPTTSGGGAAFVNGTLDIFNSTLSGNVVDGENGSGGGLLASSVLTRIVNSTITNNSAEFVGGGIAEVAAGSLTLDNSIVAGNNGPDNSPDLFVSISNPDNFRVRFSLIGDRLGTALQESQTPDADGNRIGSSTGGGVIDPVLGPLADNGGVTPTHLPLSGSLAIGGGNDDLAVDASGQPLPFDGRGAPLERLFGIVDQGAVEVQPPREAIIDWPRPANIFVGTPLSNIQLNASTNTPGTFLYTPADGTVLSIGDDQNLSVQFIPNNLTVYATTTSSVAISVVDRADRGDAPESYGTFHRDNGPSHGFDPELHLGSSIDVEVDGLASVDASGDGGDDDGVSFITTLVTDPTRLTLATVLVNTSKRGKLDAWIDFDGNGQFDHATEHLSNGESISVSTGDNRISFVIPAGAVNGTTFARFRLSSEGGLLPLGPASDGEVEDYAITLVDGTTTPDVMIGLTLGQSTLKRDGDEVIVGRDNRDFFRVPFSSVASFEFQGNATSNVLTVDATAGNPIPGGGVKMDGASGVNTIRLVGPDLTLDLTPSGNATLTNIDVIDMTDQAESMVRIDAAAARRMDGNSNGSVLVGIPSDQLQIVDGELWRMEEPSGVAGFFFSFVRLPDTFIQTDFSSPWQNLAQASDINNDGFISAADALPIINELDRRAFSNPATSELVSPADVSAWPDTYYDQDGDGRLTALDALRVINDIARSNFGSGEWIAASFAWPDVHTDDDDDQEDSDEASSLW
ncbi:MAG: choice-of-anchor Q domain-containing protein [Planctomycetota bacterium]